MDCPRCHNNNKKKDGFVNGLQRYQCKACSFRFSVERKSDVKSLETRRLALEMYLEGLGFRAIGRILKISYGTVYQWIKQWGSNVSLPKRQQGLKVVEIDELHSYINSKKATVGYGLLLIDLAKGTSLMCVEIDQQLQD